MESQHHPPVPVRPKNFTQSISLIVGFILCVIGLCGLQFPAFAGLHLSVIFSIITFIAGATLIWNGYKNYHAHDAFLTCLGFGIFFALISLLGFTLGERGVPSIGFQAEDPFVFRLIPGYVESGLHDHILYGVISLILFGGAIDWFRRHRIEGLKHSLDIHYDNKIEDVQQVVVNRPGVDHPIQHH